MTRFVLVAAAFGLLPVPAAAQAFDAVGTRAAGMGVAAVAVADDASAVYWNPGGLVFGSTVSFVVDRRDGETDPDQSDRAGSRSSFLLGLTTPALGLSYYRLRTTSLATLPTDGTGPGQVHLETLITHHTGATLVQSIVPAVAVGTTLKLVRGVASTGTAEDGDRDAILDAADDLVGKATNKFDLDVGVMARIGRMKAGVMFRNLTEPSFETPGGDRLTLERQARVGVSFSPSALYIVAADLDVLTTQGTFGDERVFAVGGETRILKRGVVRAGLHVNTVSDAPDGTPTYTFGASYRIYGAVLVDTQINSGSDKTERGWGISARFVY